jgi:hypothetical protein
MSDIDFGAFPEWGEWDFIKNLGTVNFIPFRKKFLVMLKMNDITEKEG